MVSPDPYYTRLGVGISCLLVFGISPFGISAQPPNSSDMPVVDQFERNLTINMESYQYTPSEISLEVGKAVTIILRNDSFLVPHNFLLDDPQGIRLIEEDVSSGEERRIQFTPAMPGIYHFYCDKKLFFFPTHREQGMEGQLLVR